MMEFTGYYHYENSGSEFITFVRNNNLIYIEIPFYHTKATMEFEDLKNDNWLYSYYLLSLHLTPDRSKIIFIDDSCECEYYPNRQWVLPTIISWEWDWNEFTEGNYISFETDPREWVLTLSSNDEIANLLYLIPHKEFYYVSPYSIMESLTLWEIDLIEMELTEEEEIIEQIEFEIKGAANLMSKFSLPAEIALLCF